MAHNLVIDGNKFICNADKYGMIDRDFRGTLSPYVESLSSIHMYFSGNESGKIAASWRHFLHAAMKGTTWVTVENFPGELRLARWPMRHKIVNRTYTHYKSFSSKNRPLLVATVKKNWNINVTQYHQFTLVYLLGITRLP